MMTLRLVCAVCIDEARKRPAVDGERSVDVPMPVSRLEDSGVYDVTCPKGHKSTVYVVNQKFELLFETGLNALVDGYPREAVSSFTAALERFYEFFWRVAQSHLGVANEHVATAWKPVARLSERQLGAYITAYLVLTKAAPSLLSSKQVEFSKQCHP